jgi:hypothetical protein
MSKQIITKFNNKMKKVFLLISMFLLSLNHSFSQTYQTQKVKGIVIDSDSKKPLDGAELTIQGSANTTKTNSEGVFEFEAVSVGTISIEISLVGYDFRVIPEITVSSGKQVDLSITLTEKLNTLSEVVVGSQRSKIRPKNEYASVSARSINIYESKKYPASVNDPGRMVQNFAGVSAANDGSNQIVVRGNSPQGVLWRLEGIEIPNPNHFGGPAGSANGGAVSMFSANTLGNSDFYTSAFPAEFGNATAGILDLSYRNGNKDKTEYSFAAGVLGLEAGVEGPFKKGGKSSFLINARYSTFALIGSFVGIGNEVPNYQDVNFKLNFPTDKFGTFGIFGLIGLDQSEREVEKDASKWDDDNLNFNGDYIANTTVFGLSHHIFVSDKSYFKTVIARTGFTNKFESTTFLLPNFGKRPVADEKTSNNAIRVSTYFNSKLSNKASLRVGGIFNQLDFDYKLRQYNPIVPEWKTLLDSKGNSNYLQAFAQMKYRISDALTLNAGIHTTRLALNNTNSFEPRVSLAFDTGNNQTITLAAGIHAKPQSLPVYYYETLSPSDAKTTPNKNLKMTVANHFVLGYDKSFDNGIKFKLETYYQMLSNVPVENKSGSGLSLINIRDIGDLFDSDPLVSKGKGTNYGVDFNLEKSFSKRYYYIANLSLFSAKYTTIDNKEYNARYNRGYQVNLVGGKEWSVSSRKNRTFGVNTKFLTSGGERISEFDGPASIASGETVYIPGKFYTQSGDPYSRFDIGLNLKTNRKKASHIISLDIQNVLGTRNVIGNFYNPELGNITKVRQLGLVPLLNYRVEF